MEQSLHSLLQFFLHLVDIFLHIDIHLNEWITILGPWTYLLLFVVVFCETGLVVTPFLPGDSLLFALGAICAIENSALNLYGVMVLLLVAAILGDAVNYAIGRKIGDRAFQIKDSRWFKKKHLIAAQEFYDKHGGKAIVMARFVPIVRTFAPFVAGIGKMKYRRFALFNFLGAFLWVPSFLFLGFFFGNIPAVKKNFEFVIIGIMFISVLPVVYGYYKERQKELIVKKAVN